MNSTMYDSDTPKGKLRPPNRTEKKIDWSIKKDPDGERPEPLFSPLGDRCIYHPGTVKLSITKLLRMQGYRDLNTVRPAIREAAEESSLLAEATMAPEIHFRCLAIRDHMRTRIELEGGVSFSGEVPCQKFARAGRVLVAVITIGKQIDNEITNSIADLNPVRALFLNTAGWLAIEWANKEFMGVVRKRAREQCYSLLTERLAPGNTYSIGSDKVLWPLEEQLALFRVFEVAKLPIKLLPGCAMMPKMSRSCVYGLVQVSDNPPSRLPEPENGPI